MPELLLNLRNVPDEEAAEVRSLMDEHAIECYETPPSAFGISAGGIWVRDSEDYPRAKELMDAYQAERAQKARAEHRRRRAEGRADTWRDLLARNPVRVIGYTLASAAILFVLLTLVVQLGAF